MKKSEVNRYDFQPGSGSVRYIRVAVLFVVAGYLSWISARYVAWFHGLG